MYPQDQPPPYGFEDPGYSNYGQQHQHQQPPAAQYHGYPPPHEQQQAHQLNQRAGYPGQGPKPGHGGRSIKTGDPNTRGGQGGTGQGQGQSRNPQPKQSGQRPQQRQGQQPKPKAVRTRKSIKDYSEISLCIKYSLFFANFFFWLTGCGCIAVGVWAWTDRGALGDLETFLSSSPLLDPVLWFILIGCVIFLLATFGCIGALRENIILLKIYSVLLGIILLLEIGGGVAIYFYRAQIEENIVGKLTDIAITNYRNNEDFQDLIDAIQTGLSCCGVNGYEDWNMNLYFNCSEAIVGNNRNLEACGVPFSCCVRDSDVVNTQCGYGIRLPTKNEIEKRTIINQIGCIDAFKAWLKTNLVVVAIVAGVILLVEVFGFCFSTSLVSDIKRQKARWRH